MKTALPVAHRAGVLRRACRRHRHFRRAPAISTSKRSRAGSTDPWALAFLPDGKMLVTERPGRLRIVTRDGKISPPVAGVPPVRASGQGGLHDVVLDRDFASNRTIYFCFAEPASGGGRTAMARARLTDGEAPQLDDVKVIFRQEGPLSSGNHYGCRIVQGRDGNLWLTMGDHFTYRDEAQNLANHIGKIVRVTPDGAVPPRQSVRRPQRRQAGDLELRPPQLAGRRAASADRQAVGARARPARRRRGQHSARRQELRLAGDRLRHRLLRARRSTRRPRSPAWSSRSNTGCRRSRPPAWRSTPATCSRPGRAACSSARSPGRCWCGSSSTARRSARRSACSTNLGERIRDVRQGPDGAIWLLTDSRQRACPARDAGEMIELISRSHVTSAALTP